MIAMTLHQAIAAMSGQPRGAVADVPVTGVSIDSRTLRPGELFFAIRGQNFDGHEFVETALHDGACACVVDAAGAPLKTTGRVIVVDDTVAALGRLAQHQRRAAQATVIAVTGSNGKTTTKGMIAHVLGSWKKCAAAARSFNNQIGVPLTLLSCAPDDDFLVIEIGTSAPGEVAQLASLAEPDAGVLTCVGDAHLAGLGGRDGVVREKMSLFEYVRAGGEALIETAALSRAETLPRTNELHWTTYGSEAGADVRITDLYADFRKIEATLAGRWPLRMTIGGAHNAVNAAGVFAFCRRMGMKERAILDALATYRLPDMRMNVHEVDGFTVVEDCYNANPTSMAAAIDQLAAVRGSRRVLLVGEMAELGDDTEELHRAAGIRAARAGVDLVVSVGHAARSVSEAAAGESPDVRTRHFADATAAAEGLRGMLATGDTVLIKGSRSARLERIVQQWRATCTEPAVAAG